MDLAKNLKIESVARLSLPPPLILAPAQTVRQAVSLMQEHRAGCLLVCQDRRVVGIFTERDLVQRVLAPGRSLDTPLAECLTAPVVTVQATEPLSTAVRKMQEGGYRHLPVVDEAGHPQSILSVKGIVRHLVEHFPATVYNQPPDPDQVQRHREGA